MVTFGQVVAYLINIAFAKADDGWRYMFGLAALPAIFQCFGMFIRLLQPEMDKEKLILSLGFERSSCIGT